MLPLESSLSFSEESCVLKLDQWETDRGALWLSAGWREQPAMKRNREKKERGGKRKGGRSGGIEGMKEPVREWRRCWSRRKTS